jgi:hypothetical protein
VRRTGPGVFDDLGKINMKLELNECGSRNAEVGMRKSEGKKFGR